MLLITNKVRITLKNELVAKQKRISHDISIFDVEIQKFLELIELVKIAQIIVFSAASGKHVSLEYSYGGNEYRYYLKDEQTEQFEQIAKEKNLKYKEHEI